MMLAVKVSLVCNAILFLIKGLTLIIVNSLALLADLGISFVALAISIFLYYAIRMSNKPADMFHNYGYGKIENVTEAIEGVILVGLALAMSFQACLHFLRPSEVGSPFLGFACSIVGMAINFWGAWYILKLGEQYASPALRAEGLHFRLEGYISTAITLSFALVMFLTYAEMGEIAEYIDPVATLVVSAVITIPSIRLLRKAFMKLLDASIEETGQMDIIKALARHYDKYCSFRDIKTRTSGRKQFVDINIVLPEHISIRRAHHVAAEISREIASTIAESEVMVHIEPCNRDCAFSGSDAKCPYES
jgi:cation diffusion facilitator family transporter